MKLKLTAQLLRYILLAAMALILVVAIASFLFATKQLQSFADSTNLLSKEAAAGDQNITNLEQLRATLALEAEAIEKTHQIVASAKSYKYQDEIVNDLTKYAAESGVVLESITFTNASDSAATGQVTPGTTPLATAPTIPGVQSRTETITLKTPVSFKNVMKFIQRIEENTTKMQIDSISMSRVVQDDVPPGYVDISTMEIQVYIR